MYPSLCIFNSLGAVIVQLRFRMQLIVLFYLPVLVCSLYIVPSNYVFFYYFRAKILSTWFGWQCYGSALEYEFGFKSGFEWKDESGSASKGEAGAGPRSTFTWFGSATVHVHVDTPVGCGGFWPPFFHARYPRKCFSDCNKNFDTVFHRARKRSVKFRLVWWHQVKFFNLFML